MKNSMRILLILSIVMTSCAPKENLSKVHWMIGTWEYKTSEGSVFERWIQLNDTAFQGKSYWLDGLDTVFLEKIDLVQKDMNLLLIPTVVDQNQGKPVQFSLSEIDRFAVVFENLQHDFPQQIAYEYHRPDSLIAIISGNQNEQERTFTVPMRRVK